MKRALAAVMVSAGLVTASALPASADPIFYSRTCHPYRMKALTAKTWVHKGETGPTWTRPRVNNGVWSHGHRWWLSYIDFDGGYLRSRNRPYYAWWTNTHWIEAHWVSDIGTKRACILPNLYPIWYT